MLHRRHHVGCPRPSALGQAASPLISPSNHRAPASASAPNPSGNSTRSASNILEPAFPNEKKTGPLGSAFIRILNFVVSRSTLLFSASPLPLFYVLGLDFLPHAPIHNSLPINKLGATVVAAPLDNISTSVGLPV